MARETKNGPKAALVGKIYRVLCLTCNRQTNHKVINSAEYNLEWSEGNFSADYYDTYQIIECQGCEAISFRHSHCNSEDIDVNDRGEPEYSETVKLFPPRYEGRPDLDGWSDLPQKVRSIYKETLSAFRSSLPILTGIGLRAIVETICVERKAVGRDLLSKIDDLVTQHVLTPDGARILHSLRVMGNEAAHEVKPHSLQKLNVAFDVVEYVLQGVYILPERAKTLPSSK